MTKRGYVLTSIGVMALLAIGAGSYWYGPGEPETPAAPAGALGPMRVKLIRFDLVVTPAAAEHLRALGEPLKTTGTGYEGRKVENELLRTAIVAEDSVKQIPFKPISVSAASQNMFSPNPGESDVQLTSQFISGRTDIPGSFQLLLGATNLQSAQVRPQENGMHLELEGKLRMGASDATAVKKELRLGFTGDIPAGHSALFIGDLGSASGQEFLHISIWEVFLCGENEYLMLRPDSVENWLSGAVAQHRADADRAIAWNRYAVTAATRSATSGRALSGGTIVRVEAVSDLLRWPDCWWDGRGNAVSFGFFRAVAFNPESIAQSQLLLAVTAEDPTAPERQTTPSEFYEGPRHSMVLAIVDAAATDLTCGVGSGPWNDAGTLVKDKPLEFDGQKVSYSQALAWSTNLHHDEGYSLLNAVLSQPRDREIQIIAVDKAGKRSEPQSPDIWLSTEKRSDAFEQGFNIHMALDEIDHYVVIWRKREWIPLTDFARVPAVLPDTIHAAH